ncbi:MAG: hypothetical protein SV062_04880 [Thermodesulfobacteriota bacterium]|nr:hypothetical protein [Thermodesulfobacteriota bacterium]
MRRNSFFIIFSLLFIVFISVEISFSIEKIDDELDRAWDIGNDEVFKKLENKITILITKGEPLSHFYLAKLYYRWASCMETKGNTSKDYWLCGVNAIENKILWNKAGTYIDKALAEILEAEGKNKPSSRIQAFKAFILCKKLLHGGLKSAYTYAKPFTESAKKALNLNDKDPYAHLALGLNEYTRPPIAGGDPKRALKHFENSINVAPDFAEGYFWLGRYWMNPHIEKDTKKAMEYFNKAYTIRPENWIFKEVSHIIKMK